MRKLKVHMWHDPKECRDCKGELERLRAENSRLLSAATEVVKAHDAFLRQGGIAAWVKLGLELNSLSDVLATSKTPAPSPSSPEPKSCQDPTPGPSSSDKKGGT